MTEKQVFDTLPLISYDINQANIAKMKADYMPLVITDLNDTEQFDAVHEARMVMVKVRNAIEKSRKSQKAGALEYGKKVDAAAQVLSAAAEPIETHLTIEEKKVTDERKRVQEEEESKFAVMVNGRVDSLMNFNVVLPYAEIAGMDSGDFDALHAAAKLDFEAEKERLAAEEAKRSAERIDLARKQEEQDKKDKEQADKEDALRLERQAFENERAVIAANLKAQTDAFEKEKREAKEKADREKFEKETEERLDREAKEKAAKAIEDARIAAEEAETARILKEAEDKAEAERKAELLPDKEKLIAWVNRIANEIPCTVDFDNDEAQTIYLAAISDIEETLTKVQAQAEAM